MRRTRIWVLGAIVALTAILTAVVVAGAATSTSTIDFEGLAAGTIVTSVSHGAGISGDDAGGSVGIFGLNPTLGGGVDAAMIFDSSCPPGGDPSDCGPDDDLGTPNEDFGGPGVGFGGNLGMPFQNDTALGNILIVSEADLNQSEPDDADLVGEAFNFDFTTWGSGVVTVDSITVLDIEKQEGGSFVEVFSGATSLGVFAFPITKDNGVAVVLVGVSGVDSMDVVLNGSCILVVDVADRQGLGHYGPCPSKIATSLSSPEPEQLCAPILPRKKGRMLQDWA